MAGTPLTPCPKCGYENRSSANRCGLCGLPFIESVRLPALASETTSLRREDSGQGELIPVRRNFAEEIESNKLKSLNLMAICILVLIATGWAVGELWIDGMIGAIFGAVLGTVVVTWAYFGGAASILAISFAVRADPDEDRQLYNIVDEMRIAAGLPMPQVRVIETEAANAFATGRDPEHATVAVTRGLMKMLNREELQGVVAHEMAHVLNYDIRFMMVVSAIVGATVMISDVGTRGWYWGAASGRSRGRGGNSGGSNPALAIFAILMIILAPVFASLLQMSISRKREFLADSTAVQLTRNPLGLASALDKIDRHLDAEPLPGASKATQHLYIANPLKHFGMKASALMSTHPPMQARINILRAMA